jgi:hypothetical protein
VFVTARPGHDRSFVPDLDDWFDRLQLVAEDDAAVEAFLDELDVRGPRERRMLAELARRTTLAEPDRFPEAHRRAIAVLESLGRHGYHSAVVPRWFGPFSFLPRFFIELVARYLVVSYLRTISIDLRNLYWLREMESLPSTDVRVLLRRARLEAENLVVIFKRREIGLPSFVIGGLLIPILITVGRLAGGAAFKSWWAATITAAVAIAVVLTATWVIFRGAAMASRRIRLATRDPLTLVWNVVGSCGRPPRDQTRKFAIIAILLTVGAWIVFPAVAAIVAAT